MRESRKKILSSKLFKRMLSEIKKHGGTPNAVYFKNHDKIVYVGEKEKIKGRGAIKI